MDMMFVTSEGIDEFKLNFDAYAKHYQDETNQWFMDHWTRLGYLQKSKLEMPELVFNYAEDMTTVDKANTIAIHGALHSLTPSQASDERLWAGLCHTVAWDFIKARRGSELQSKTGEKLTTHLKGLYFYNAGIKRSGYLNAIAKYWWTGHLIFDPKSNNPYAALDVLCSASYFSSLMLVLSSTNFMSNKDVINGMIDSIRKAQESGIQISRAVWDELLKYLNGYASAVLIDALSREDITYICDQKLPQIIGK